MTQQPANSNEPADMAAFVEVEYVLPTASEFVRRYREHAMANGSTKALGQLNNEAMAAYNRVSRIKVKENGVYRVEIDANCEHSWPMMTLWHLAISRIDGSQTKSWEDLQAIKNHLVGPDVEAVELYPHANREVRIGDQTHLWCFFGQRGDVAGKGGGRPILPFGFFTDATLAVLAKPGENAGEGSAP